MITYSMHGYMDMLFEKFHVWLHNEYSKFHNDMRCRDINLMLESPSLWLYDVN